eukprot:scaffold250687_cov20-Prasinocladus_malaysianus.AAC.2
MHSGRRGSKTLEQRLVEAPGPAERQYHVAAYTFRGRYFSAYPYSPWSSKYEIRQVITSSDY